MDLDRLQGLNFAFAVLGLSAAVVVAVPAFVVSHLSFSWALSRHGQRVDVSWPRWISVTVLWISGIPAAYVAGLFFGVELLPKTVITLVAGLVVALSNLIHAAYRVECIARVMTDRLLVEPRFAGTLRSRALARAALVFLVYVFIEGALFVANG